MILLKKELNSHKNLSFLTKIREKDSEPLVEFFFLVGPFSYLCLSIKISSK